MQQGMTLIEISIFLIPLIFLFVLYMVVSRGELIKSESQSGSSKGLDGVAVWYAQNIRTKRQILLFHTLIYPCISLIFWALLFLFDPLAAFAISYFALASILMMMGTGFSLGYSLARD